MAETSDEEWTFKRAVRIFELRHVMTAIPPPFNLPITIFQMFKPPRLFPAKVPFENLGRDATFKEIKSEMVLEFLNEQEKEQAATVEQMVANSISSISGLTHSLEEVRQDMRAQLLDIADRQRRLEKLVEEGLGKRVDVV